MLKVYGFNIFPLTPPPIKGHVLYTRFNVDNYGWPLIKTQFGNWLLPPLTIQRCYFTHLTISTDNHLFAPKHHICRTFKSEKETWHFVKFSTSTLCHTQSPCNYCINILEIPFENARMTNFYIQFHFIPVIYIKINGKSTWKFHFKMLNSAPKKGITQ